MKFLSPQLRRQADSRLFRGVFNSFTANTCIHRSMSTSTSSSHPSSSTSLPLRQLGSTPYQITPVAFGSYRVDFSTQHREALQLALQKGVNIIDTSANYTDGHSEAAIGQVLQENNIDRKSVVIVSKAGYIQGSNYQRSLQRKAQRKPYTDLVEIDEGLEHCIHPDFLAEQLTLSLQRLQTSYIDVYLLHNPEYFLQQQQTDRKPLEQSRQEYYRRIKLAFEHLESEVAKGKIKYYGISSNTFPSDSFEYDATSLSTCWSIAEHISRQHHFRVIQFPFNMLEIGAVTNKNQHSVTMGDDGKITSNVEAQSTLIEFATAKQLGVLTNRPLNAFYNNSLVRFSDVHPSSTGIKQVIESIESQWKASTLSQTTVKAIASQQGVSCVLVGMRKVSSLQIHHSTYCIFNVVYLLFFVVYVCF